MIATAEQLADGSAVVQAEAATAKPAPRLATRLREFDETAQARRLFRGSGTLLILFQFVYVAADFYAKPGFARSLLGYHLINLSVTATSVGLTWGPHFERVWRPAALLCAAILIAVGTRMSVLSGDVEPRFISLLLFAIGSATFAPWGARWQALMNLVCLTSFAIDAVLVPFTDQYTTYRWVGMLAGLAMAQYTASFLARYRRDLFTQLQQLERNAEFRERQIAMMGHDIRSPLSIISGYLHLLEEPGIQESQKAEMHARIGSAIKTIDSLAANLLDLYRLEEGSLQPQVKVVDANEIVSRVVDDYQVEARRKGLELTVSLSPVPHTPLDPQHLERVLVNLLTNAIKFTPSGKVRVATGSDERNVKIEVSDTGLGIAHTELPRLFTRFHRPHHHDNSVGLGLYISRALAEANGGAIEVASKPGAGSRFTVRLPLSAAVQEAPDRSGLHARAG